MQDLNDTQLDEWLTRRREIAIRWSVEDVQEVRPDLNPDQCWQVLVTARDEHDALIGLSWDMLELYAEQLFGPALSDKEHDQ